MPRLDGQHDRGTSACRRIVRVADDPQRCGSRSRPRPRRRWNRAPAPTGARGPRRLTPEFSRMRRCSTAAAARKYGAPHVGCNETLGHRDDLVAVLTLRECRGRGRSSAQEGCRSQCGEALHSCDRFRGFPTKSASHPHARGCSLARRGVSGVPAASRCDTQAHLLKRRPLGCGTGISSVEFERF
jgi:hypothetical protein